MQPQFQRDPGKISWWEKDKDGMFIPESLPGLLSEPIWLITAVIIGTNIKKISFSKYIKPVYTKINNLLSRFPSYYVVLILTILLMLKGCWYV